VGGPHEKVSFEIYGPEIGAQAWVPSRSSAHSVPAQHDPSMGSHGPPGGVHTAPGSTMPVVTQLARPSEITQLPPQQSSSAAHGAPVGAHDGRQERAPRLSGRQRPAQHRSLTAHGYPAAMQAPPESGWPRHRSVPVSSARHEPALLSQHSSDFMQRSPSGRHIPFPGPQCALPIAGSTMQLPEQQLAPAAQRSPSG